MATVDVHDANTHLSWPLARIAQGFAGLPLTSEHAEAALALPPIHRDPVDRFLVAQALVEGLTLVTDDETVRRDPVPTL